MTLPDSHHLASQQSESGPEYRVESPAAEYAESCDFTTHNNYWLNINSDTLLTFPSSSLRSINRFRISAQLLNQL